MWELDYKESWMPKNWCFWTVVLEKTLESSLDCKEIQPVHSKGNQPWIFIPILWPPDAKNQLIGKAPDAGKDWRQEEKGMTEDEMVGWHHQLDGHEFEQAPGVGDAQGSLTCCNPWGCKELDMTELNWNVPHSRRIIEHSRIRKKWLFKFKMTVLIDCFLKIKPEFCFYVIFSRHPKDVKVILDLKTKEGGGQGGALSIIQM